MLAVVRIEFFACNHVVARTATLLYWVMLEPTVEHRAGVAGHDATVYNVFTPVMHSLQFKTTWTTLSRQYVPTPRLCPVATLSIAVLHCLPPQPLVASV